MEEKIGAHLVTRGTKTLTRNSLLPSSLLTVNAVCVLYCMKGSAFIVVSRERVRAGEITIKPRDIDKG